MINVKVNKQGTENSMGMIRRFQKRVQGSGVLRRARSIRYHKRSESPYVRKSQALNRLRKREQFEKLVRLGKVAENPRRRR